MAVQKNVKDTLDRSSDQRGCSVSCGSRQGVDEDDKTATTEIPRPCYENETTGERLCDGKG